MTQEHYATKSQLDRLALRVDSLDDELKLLKAQIQATLLTIQECILCSTFPALGEGYLSQPAASGRRQWNVKKLGVGQVRAVAGVFSPDDGFEPDAVPPFDPPILTDDETCAQPPNFLPVEYDDDPPLPQAPRPAAPNNPSAIPAFDWQTEAVLPLDETPIRPLYYENHYTPTPNPEPLTAAYPEPPQVILPAAPACQPESVNVVHTDAPATLSFEIWRELDKWVTEKIREVGIGGTLELAQLCGGQQRDTLLKIIAVYQARAAETPMPQPATTPPQPPSPPPTAPPEQHSPAADVKYATYRPFGEHQELALQLLEQVLRSRETVKPATNGNGNGRH